MERLKSVVALVLSISFIIFMVQCDKNEKSVYEQRRRMQKPPDSGEWKKKDILDYNDMDVEKLADQWEEGDEELPVDELPPWELEPPPIDMSKIDIKNKDTLITEGKRARTLMMFATVAGPVSRKRTEEVSQIWEQGLFNANIQVKRYVIDDDRVLFQMDDGSLALKIKDFLVQQETCLDVTLEQKTYDGRGKNQVDKMKPLTKEEMAVRKKEEAKQKAEREARIQESRRLREAREKEKAEKKKKKTTKSSKKKDEL